jgi:hypothetical protein
MTEIKTPGSLVFIYNLLARMVVNIFGNNRYNVSSRWLKKPTLAVYAHPKMGAYRA